MSHHSCENLAEEPEPEVGPNTAASNDEIPVSRRPSNSTHSFFDQSIPDQRQSGSLLQVPLNDQTQSSTTNNLQPVQLQSRENAITPDEETLDVLNSHGFVFTVPGIQDALAAMDHQADGPRSAAYMDVPLVISGETSTEGPSGDMVLSEALQNYITLISTGDHNQTNDENNNAAAFTRFSSMSHCVDYGNIIAIESVRSTPASPMALKFNQDFSAKSSPSPNEPDPLASSEVGSKDTNLSPHHAEGHVIDYQNRVDPSATFKPLQPDVNNTGLGNPTSASDGLTPGENHQVVDSSEKEVSETVEMNFSRDAHFHRDLEKRSAFIVSNVIRKATKLHLQQSSYSVSKGLSDHKDLIAISSGKLSRTSQKCDGVRRIPSSTKEGCDNQYNYESDFESEGDRTPIAKIDSGVSTEKISSGHDKKDNDKRLGSKYSKTMLTDTTEGLSLKSGKDSQRTDDTSTKQSKEKPVDLNSPLLSKRKIQGVDKNKGRRSLENRRTVNKPQNADCKALTAAAKAYAGRKKVGTNSPSPGKTGKMDNKFPPIKSTDQTKKKSNPASSIRTSMDREKSLSNKSSGRDQKTKQVGSLSNVKKGSHTKQSKTVNKSNKLPPLSLNRSRDSDEEKRESYRKDQLIRALGAGARSLRELEKGRLLDHEQASIEKSDSSPSSTKQRSSGSGNSLYGRRNQRFSLGEDRRASFKTYSGRERHSFPQSDGRQRQKPSLPSILKSEAYWQNGQLHIRINGSARLIPQAEKILEENNPGIDGEEVPLDVRITLVKNGTTAKAKVEKAKRGAASIHKAYNGPLAYPHMGVNKNPGKTVAERTILDTRTVHSQFNTKTARVTGQQRRDSASSSSTGFKM